MRVMPIFKKELNLPKDLSRAEVKRYVIECFLDEEPGTGKRDLASKYFYNVECCENRNIFIARPATLNYGMDFTVHVSGVEFRPKYAYKDRPKHDDIIQDLMQKKSKDPITYQKLAHLIQKIFLCQDVEKEELRSLTIDAGLLTCEEVSLVAKWLFIEQDVTYWNYSGRAMFYSALLDNELVEPLPLT